MMNAELSAEPLRPVEALSALIARYGLIRIVLALPMALIRHRRDQTLLAYALSPHLMRDIGIVHDRSGYWELR